MDKNQIFTVALALCNKLERRTLNRLVHRLGSAERVWKASAAEWRTAVHLRDGTAAALDEWRRTQQPRDLWHRLKVTGIAAVTEGDDAYPRQLLAWGEEAPVTLFVKGRLELLTKFPLISVIGTRRASAYGLEATRWVTEGLVRSGCVITSGMALGIDAQAHRTALDLQGETIAVLGCGVNLCYPPSNLEIYHLIEKHGTLVSEYPPDTPVAKHHFLERNRIIAALPEAVVVVQAGEKSGALTTVDAALSVGKDVYAVPGPITSKLFRGSNRLLKDGAEILLDPADLVESLGVAANVVEAPQPERWQSVVEALDTATSAADLADRLRTPISQVYVALLELELDGWIVRVPGGFYQRNSQRFATG